MKKKRDNKKSPPKSALKVIVFNILFGAILLFTLNTLQTKHKAYYWLMNNLLAKNLEVVEKNKTTTIAQRNEQKQGFFYRYLSYINEKSPEDAIILIPHDSLIDKIDKKFNLKFLKDRRKTTYFIYPRRAVYEKYKDSYDSSYFDKVTHVAIVDYKGYDLLHYNVKRDNKFILLPIDLPKQ